MKTLPASQTRKAVSWIAVGTMLFGVWLAPACAFICANMAPEAPGVGASQCHADHGTGHCASPKSSDSRTPLCAHLQNGVQPNAQPEIASSFPAVFHALAGAEHVSPQAAGKYRPWLPTMALGPPIPPPLFTVLRS
jgi:hypothetical protein